MDMKSLQERIKEEANRRVQLRIKEFRAHLANALTLLETSKSSTWYDSNNDEMSLNHIRGKFGGRVLSALLSETPRKGWPTELWSEEEARVTEEVMATMNSLQKLFVPCPVIENPSSPPDKG